MINRLTVKNYRCLDGFDLSLSGNTSALLIGKNGVGKTTVLRCFRILQNICRNAGRTGKLIVKSDFVDINRPLYIEIEAKLNGKNFNYYIGFEWPVDFREARIVEECLKVDGQNIISRQLAQVTYEKNESFGLDWHVFALPVINERFGQHVIQDFKSYLASMIIISPIPANMTGFSEEVSLELNYDASNYASCLRGLLGKKPAAYAKFSSYIKNIFPDFSSIVHTERGENGTQLVVMFQQDGAEKSKSIDFRSLSDGEKCFFLSAYLVACNTDDSPVVCIWDEPDNHLSLSEVGQFVLALRKEMANYGQFIATTHHPETIRRFSEDNTYVLIRSNHFASTSIKQLKDIKYNGDLIDSLIREDLIYGVK